MSKQNLIEKVVMDSSLTVAEATCAVNAVLAAIPELAATGTLQLRGFGTFKTVTKKARTARNPKTGEEITVPEKRVLKFKPATTK